MFYSIRRTKSEMVASICGEFSNARIVVKGNTISYDRPNGDKVIRLHLTDVATIHTDGSVTVDSGGFETHTTKARINDYLPSCAGLYQENHVWYVHAGPVGDRFGDAGKRYLFADGMTVAPDGTVTGAELAPKKAKGNTSKAA